jgi:hypothetical protein
MVYNYQYSAFLLFTQDIQRGEAVKISRFVQSINAGGFKSVARGIEFKTEWKTIRMGWFWPFNWGKSKIFGVIYDLDFNKQYCFLIFAIAIKIS